MIVLSWNCRGLGSLCAVPIIKDLVWEHKPDVLFLCETLVHAKKVEEFRIRLGFDCCLGLGEGVVLLCSGRTLMCVLL